MISFVPLPAMLAFVTGQHQPLDDYKIALYTDVSQFDEKTFRYVANDESQGPGYEAGGKVLTGFDAGIDDDVVYISFDNPVWGNASITAVGALIYNYSKNNTAVAVLQFDDRHRSTVGRFTVHFPPAGKTAVITFKVRKPNG